MPHYPEFVFVNLNDRVGGLHGVHHAFEREVMNIVFYAIVARVIVMSWKGWAAAPQTGTYRGPSLIQY